ncbi:MAG: right-handed parallel beta-helix repeat-containing protein [Candidatus Eisenbacteria sp.]|nr:right-handed parallel beta-helix repeat-containing protein [Candidatus Eisenbacteria bacterium]
MGRTSRTLIGRSLVPLVLVSLLTIGCGDDGPTFPVSCTYTVSPDGSGDFPTIQAAIDSASAGDVIELTSGIFAGEGNRDIDYLGKAITIRSASGDPDSCIIDCEGDATDPHRAFTFCSGEGSHSVLEGVTVINGYRVGEGLGHIGGAVYCDDSSPKFVHCTFAGNSANKGGAIYCTWNTHPTITECAFKSNSAAVYGGGMYCNGSDPRLTNCTFLDNRAAQGGGGIFCASAYPTLTNCTFADKTAGSGGGIMCWDSGPSLTDCSFTGCSAQFSGGGMQCSEDSSPSLTRCEFTDNLATVSGAGICCQQSSSPVLVSCLFARNQAQSRGGAVYCRVRSSPVLTDCILTENSAAHGGALYCEEYSSPMISGCTFSANAAEQHGAGLYCFYNSSPILENSIIAFSPTGEAIFCKHSDETSLPLLTCCNLFGNAGGDWVGRIEDQAGLNGNISEDPLFCDRNGGIFLLQLDSPCSAANSACGLVGAQPVGCD